MHCRPLAVLLLLAAAASSADAQSGQIHGRVLRASSDSPIANAVVTLVGTRLVVFSDSLGAFSIAGAPRGVHELEATRAGLTIARDTVVVRPDAVARIELRLADAPHQIAGVTVIGRAADALSRLPGSAALVSARQLASQLPLSANEALRTVPGVHVVDEEGAGLRANIGVRGLDPDRSRTLLMLEDGVPVALAPYGEPEMYYSPPIDRMERVEIVKGSGSILFGPQTIGGVVNYVTADAPLGFGGRVEAQGGTGDVRLLKLRAGGTQGALRGVVNALQRRADDFNGLRFDVRDLTGKGGIRTAAGDFGLKLSAYDESSNATYVGLTDSLFRTDPHVHPQPGDELQIRRYAATGSHEIALASGRTTIRTNVYGYRTTRDWNRRDYTYGPGGNSHVFANGTGGRNRSFDVAGIEPRLSTSWMAGSMGGDFDVGVRAHYEKARDQFVVGRIDSDETTLRDDEVRIGRAVAVYAQNRFHLTPSLHVTPGVRVEHFDYERNILVARVRRSTGTGATRLPEEVDVRSSDAVTEVIPGIGAAWSPHALLTVFVGAHRGFAPPRTKDALIYPDPTLAPDAQVPDPVSLQLDAERSWNYEIGTRVTPTAALSLEATGFVLDFSNQIIEPSLSAGAVSQAALANQGATRHTGVEVAAGLDVGKLLEQPWSLALGAAYTYSVAEFSRDRYLQNAAGDTVNVRGHTLPYAPRNRVHGSATFSSLGGFLLRVDANYTGSQFADNFETVAGSANGRIGEIPSILLVDVATHYRLPRFDGVTLVGSVKNVADRTYIASRRPEGIKTGLPRIARIGLTWDF